MSSDDTQPIAGESPTDADILDVPSAARLLGMSRNSLYDAIGRGEVPHRRIGRLIRLSRSGLLEWLRTAEPLNRRSR